MDWEGRCETRRWKDFKRPAHDPRLDNDEEIDLFAPATFGPPNEPEPKPKTGGQFDLDMDADACTVLVKGVTDVAMVTAYWGRMLSFRAAPSVHGDDTKVVFSRKEDVKLACRLANNAGNVCIGGKVGRVVPLVDSAMDVATVV